MTSKKRISPQGALESLKRRAIRRDNIKLLEEICHEKGVSEDRIAYLKKIMNAESTDGVDTKNPNSSATGLFQFIDGTWDKLVKNHKDLDINGHDDPRQQILAAIYFTKDNEIIFKRRLERAPDHGELYLMHFAEKHGIRAIELAKIDPNTPIQNVMTDREINANSYKSEKNQGVRIDFKDGGFLPIEKFKVGDFVNWSNGKMGLPDKYKTDSSPQYKRDKRGVPDSQGNWVMVAIAAVAAVVVAAVAMFSDDDDGNLKSPSTPRRPRGHSPSPA